MINKLRIRISTKTIQYRYKNFLLHSWFISQGIRKALPRTSFKLSDKSYGVK